MLSGWKDKLLAGALAGASFFGGRWVTQVDSNVEIINQHSIQIAVLTKLAEQNQQTNAEVAYSLKELKSAIEVLQRRP